MVGKNVEVFRQQVTSEGFNSPDDSETLLLGRRIVSLALVQTPTGTADDPFLPFLYLGQDGSEARIGGVGVQPEGLTEVWVGCYWGSD